MRKLRRFPGVKQLISILLLFMFANLLLQNSPGGLSPLTAKLPVLTTEPNEPKPASPSAIAKAEKADYGNLPLNFEPNLGQSNQSVQFLAHANQYNLFLTKQELVLTPQTESREQRATPQAMVTMTWLEGNAEPLIQPMEQQEGVSNYFIGNDPAQWYTAIPNYGGVLYKGVYDGIDLRFHSNEGKLQYDFVVQPGANPNQIKLGFAGADHLAINPEGQLVLELPNGTLTHSAPILYQEINGQQLSVQGSFSIVNDLYPLERRKSSTVNFTIRDYDPDFPLIIDPTVNYSSYLGGSGNDYGYSVAVDSSGNTYLTGETNSTNFPTTSPFQTNSGGGTDVFVTKLNATGNGRVYSTYLGGAGIDTAYKIKVDSTGNAYITGQTASTNFPTASALQATYNGGTKDVFITKLNAAGSSLVFSTYLGGNADDSALGLGVDSSFNVYVCGKTASPNFILFNPQQSVYGGGSSDAFVSKLLPAGTSLAFSTFLGGTALDACEELALSSTNSLYLVGSTVSNNFPTVNPFQPTFGGGVYDIFVAKLTGSTYNYVTYLGGSGDDLGYAIAVDSSNQVYISGTSDSANFPLAAPLQAVKSGGLDTIVTKFNATGNALIFSSYLGGSGTDLNYALALDGANNVYVIGTTNSTNFPIANALQAGYGGGLNDGYVTRITATGSLSYSTYLGGSANDVATDIASDSSGNLYVVGFTDSADFPTAKPFQAAIGGFTDSFITKINAVSNPLPSNTQSFENAKPHQSPIFFDLPGLYFQACFSNWDWTLPTDTALKRSPAPGQPGYAMTGNRSAAVTSPNNKFSCQMNVIPPNANFAPSGLRTSDLEEYSWAFSVSTPAPVVATGYNDNGAVVASQTVPPNTSQGQTTQVKLDGVGMTRVEVSVDFSGLPGGTNTSCNTNPTPQYAYCVAMDDFSINQYSFASAVKLLGSGTYRLATTQNNARPKLTSIGGTPTAGNSSTTQITARGQGAIPPEAIGIVGVLTNLECTGGANFRFWTGATVPNASNLNVPGANSQLNLSSGFVAPLDSEGKFYLGLGSGATTTCGYIVDVVGYIASSSGIAFLPNGTFRLAQTPDSSRPKLISTGTTPTTGNSSTTQITAWGFGGIPNNATGIFGVLTNVGCNNGGNFRFWTGATVPNASNLNVPGAFYQLNLSTNFIAPLDNQGKFYLGLASGVPTTCGYIVDVVGYLVGSNDISLLSGTTRIATSLNNLSPKLVSGGANPALTNNSTLQIPIGGTSGIPADSKAVVGVLTNISCSGGGNFRFWIGSTVPNASNLNVPGALPQLNLSTGFTAPVDPNGKVYLGLGSGVTTSCGYAVDIIGFFK